MNNEENACKWYKVSFYLEGDPYVHKRVEIEDSETKGILSLPYESPFSWLKRVILSLNELGIVIKGAVTRDGVQYLLSDDFTKGIEKKKEEKNKYV